MPFNRDFIVHSILLIMVLTLFILPVGAQEDGEDFHLTIMHTNNVQASHQPDNDDNGGAARMATIVNQIREEAENSLLLDAGDRFTGTLFHSQWHGEDNVQIMNAIGYDAMTLGNHEFDQTDGDDELAAFISAVDFPVVAANVDFSESPVLAGLVEPYVVLEVGGQQIGVIGVVSPEIPVVSSPGDELVFEEDVITITQGIVDELSEMGIDKIILLSHLGYDSRFQNDLEVAQGVSGVDVIVNADSGILLSNTADEATGPYPIVLQSASGEPVLLVQAGEKAQYLGRLDVEFDADGVLTDWEGDAIFLSSNIAPDPVLSGIVDALAALFDENWSLVIGSTTVDLTGGEPEMCRIGECLLGDLIADALRMETRVDIVVQNSGAIRANIAAGEVTLGNVADVLPFENTIGTLRLNGRDVWTALENGVALIELDEDGNPILEDADGRFLQVSGLRYTFDASQEVGSRIVSVDVWIDGEWAPLDFVKIYKVATNDYLLAGGDDYSIFVTDAINPHDFSRLLVHVVAEHIAAHNPISYELDGRITHVGGE